jgi:uncharacterized protein (DUF433 family)
MATTTQPTRPRAPIERTEHPHVVKSADMRGGEPHVDGEGVSVRHLYNMAEAGWTVDQMLESYPFLTRAQVYDAVSYGYDHPDEMAYHEERHKLRNVMKKHDMVLVGDRLIFRDQLAQAGVPSDATVYTWETLPEGYGE